MPTAYLETTVPSYLVAKPSRDPLIAFHQQVTQQWWKTTALDLELCISAAVLSEIQRGDSEWAKLREAAVDGLRRLEINDKVLLLRDEYSRSLGLTGTATADLIHLACAVAHEMDYLVTWNCSHLANGQVMRKLNEVNRRLNLFIPLIVTPQQLLTEPGD